MDQVHTSLRGLAKNEVTGDVLCSASRNKALAARCPHLPPPTSLLLHPTDPEVVKASADATARADVGVLVGVPGMSLLKQVQPADASQP